MLFDGWRTILCVFVGSLTNNGSKMNFCCTEQFEKWSKQFKSFRYISRFEFLAEVHGLVASQ